MMMLSSNRYNNNLHLIVATVLAATAINILTCTHALTLTPPHQQHAIVVGGGPVGIAAALTLASHHNYTVTVLESSPAGSSQTKYDPSTLQFPCVFSVCLHIMINTVM